MSATESSATSLYTESPLEPSVESDVIKIDLCLIPSVI